MKVFGFVGCPRKQGNADILVDRFLEGAAAAQAETKKFFLAALNIHQCRGCYNNCMLQPGYRCAVSRDDMDMLMDEIAGGAFLFLPSPCTARATAPSWRNFSSGGCRSGMWRWPASPAAVF